MQIPLSGIRLDRLEQALGSVFAEATAGEVFWGYTAPAHESLPASYVEMTMLVGPTPHLQAQRRGTVVLPIDTVDFTVTSATAGARAGIVLNGFSYFTDTIGGDTLTTIAARLVAAIEGDAIEAVSAAAGAPGVLGLTADSLGAIRELRIFGPLTASNIVTNPQAVKYLYGEQEIVVTVNTYSKSPNPSAGAWALAGVCESALQTSLFVDRLAASGIAVGFKGTPIDLSELTGPRWTSRTAFDVTLMMMARSVQPVEVIETVDVTTNASGPLGLLSTQTFTVTAP